MPELIPFSPRPTRRTAFQAAPPPEDDPLLQFAPDVHTARWRKSVTPGSAHS